MKLQGGVRAFIFLIALYGATYTLSEPPPVRSLALLASIDWAQSGSIENKIKTSCRKGHEYFIAVTDSGIKAIIAKRPPALASEESLPPGIVRYNDIAKGGYVSLTCKEGQNVGDAIPSGTNLHPGYLNPATPPGAKSVVIFTKTEESGAFNPSFSGYSLDKAISGQTVSPLTQTDPAGGMELTGKILYQEIQETAQQNIQSTPKLKDNAFQLQLCQQAGTCGMGVIESGDSPLSQQLREQMQRTVRQDYFSAIQQAYGDIPVTPVGDNSVTSASVQGIGSRYYDNDTGLPFLNKAAGDSAPTIITNDSKNFPTSAPITEWGGALQSTIDSPHKYQIFENEYFGNGSEPISFKRQTPYIWGPESVTVQDLAGPDTRVPLDAYNAVRTHGDVVTGTHRTIEDIGNLTSGKVSFDSPYSFPKETMPKGALWYYSLTPSSGTERAAALNVIKQELEKYPSAYWANANSVTIYTYNTTQESPRGGGFSSNDSKTILVPANAEIKYPAMIDHELTHYNDTQLFGSDANWGTSIYGAQYGDVYGAKNGVSGVSDKMILNVRPEGFINQYPLSRASVNPIKEDQGITVQSMFTNYSGIEAVALNDSTLAAKVDLVKQGFYNMSSGVMDDQYWEKLKPIDPLYEPYLKTYTPTQQSPQPNFITKVLRVIGF